MPDDKLTAAPLAAGPHKCVWPLTFNGFGPLPCPVCGSRRPPSGCPECGCAWHKHESDGCHAWVPAGPVGWDVTRPGVRCPCKQPAPGTAQAAPAAAAEPLETPGEFRKRLRAEGATAERDRIIAHLEAAAAGRGPWGWQGREALQAFARQLRDLGDNDA
jgi:hypothetical protein